MALLPRTPIREYDRNAIIYNLEDHAEALCLVIEGRVKVSRPAEGGKEVVFAFLGPDSFFGETALLGPQPRGELAVAVDPTSLMYWTLPDLKRLMARNLALGPALWRVLAEKLSEANRRIESLCRDPIHRRLARALVGLGERMGQTGDGHELHLPPVTHEQLAGLVGTSREIVTQHMNQFRRQRLLKYSRRGLDLDLAALHKYLGLNGALTKTSTPAGSSGPESSSCPPG